MDGIKSSVCLKSWKYSLNFICILQVDHAAAIKEYSRSSADQEEPLPHELRPSEVLSMTMDYLVTNIMDQGEGNYREWYDFVWNRTRGIRKVSSGGWRCLIESISHNPVKSEAKSNSNPNVLNCQVTQSTDEMSFLKVVPDDCVLHL